MTDHETRPHSLQLLSVGDASIDPHAYLEINRGRRALELYCRGFFEASEQLLDSCATNSGPIDVLFYPAVFLFRHGLELAFKALHAAATERTGKPRPALKGHNLKGLWLAVREDLDNYVLPYEPESEPDWTLL